MMVRGRAEVRVLRDEGRTSIAPRSSRGRLTGLIFASFCVGAASISCQSTGRLHMPGEPATCSDDLKAIERLHRADARATKALDVDALLDLWAEDGVMLRPGSPPIIGKEEIGKVLRKWNPNPDEVEVVRTDIDFQEIKIIGDWAIEYGTYDSAWRAKGEDQPQTITGNILRVLRRQKDGQWKCARAIWNTHEETQ